MLHSSVITLLKQAQRQGHCFNEQELFDGGGWREAWRRWWCWVCNWLLCSSQPALLSAHHSQADENQSLSQQVQSCSSLHQSTNINNYSSQSRSRLISSIMNFLTSFKIAVWSKSKTLVCSGAISARSTTGRCLPFWNVLDIPKIWWVFSMATDTGERESTHPSQWAQRLAEWSPWQSRIPEGKKERVIIWLQGAIKTWSNLLRSLLSLPNS